jgi:hypothetical protein
MGGLRCEGTREIKRKTCFEIFLFDLPFFQNFVVVTSNVDAAVVPRGKHAQDRDGH